MKISQYVGKRRGNWYFEYAVLTKFEHTALHIDFVISLRNPKEKVFMLGFTIFTLTLFFIEIAYLTKKD